MWSMQLRFFLYPHWLFDRSLLVSKYHTRRLFIILSRVLHRQLVRAIGLWFSGLDVFFPGLGIGITVAFFHSSGKVLLIQMSLYSLRRRFSVLGGICLRKL